MSDAVMADQQAGAPTAYLMTATISTPLYGKLSDLYGRRRVTAIGCALMIVFPFIYFGLLDTLSKHDPSKVVRMMNLATVSQARAHVFGIDDSQLAFVKHHLGEAAATSPLPDGPRQEALATLKRRPAG